ncbi:hypothetical protein Dimus_003817 [Dionaea muscipula]
MHASRGLTASCGARGQRAMRPPPSCGQQARAMRPPPGVRAAPRGLATTSIRAATSSVEGGLRALSPGGQPDRLTWFSCSLPPSAAAGSGAAREIAVGAVFLSLWPLSLSLPAKVTGFFLGTEDYCAVIICPYTNKPNHAAELASMTCFCYCSTVS